MLFEKKNSEDKTIVQIGSSRFGSKEIQIIAGPCAVESYDQIFEVAENLSAQNVKILRGGAFKFRTSPYSFQGLGEDGLKLMRSAADKYGMKIISEALDEGKVSVLEKYVDIIQVGARNMHNTSLLERLGKSHLPVLLKRSWSASIDEFLMSAEYILANGNKNVILCERGIRTFEKHSRNTLDLTAIPIIKSKTHLPIIVDPSHSTGQRGLVEPMSLAAIACGADGLLIEVHSNPETALSDAEQSIDCKELQAILSKAKAIADVLSRKL